MIIDMLRLQKLWRKKSQAKGIVGISYRPDGIAIAISDFVENKKPLLKYCEFIPALDISDHPRILGDLVSRHHLNDYDCHVVLTANNYSRINIEAPAVAENEIAKAIHWKIYDLFDFPIDDAFVDYYSLPVSIHASGNKMLEVFACPKVFIEKLADKSSRAGLQVKVIEIQETALRNLAELLPENESGVALFILDEFSGTLLIQKEGTIYLSRNFHIGYLDLELDSQNSSIYGQSKVEQGNLALEIQRSLDYVESYYGITPVSGLAVVPLARNTQALLTMLNNNLGITAKVIDISALVSSDISLTDVTQSKCSGVIGSMLRHVESVL
jgi:MSHA biogenesis protein MshI